MLQKARDLALARGGECLSLRYVNTDSKLEWKCAEGHLWSAKLNHVKDSGSWCPRCARRKPGLIDSAKAYAASRGGECLSEVFGTTGDYLRWRCVKGHEWSSTYRNAVYLKHWCAACVGRHNHSLDSARAVAAKRGGACLAEYYHSAKAPLRWRCVAGHEWFAALSSVEGQGSWCAECIGRGDRLPDLRRHAETLGGKCLAVSHKSMKTKVQWECAEEHQWLATADNVLNGGKWCPYCRFRSEGAVRDVFEQTTGHAFPKVRGVLADPRLELDGYCAELRIAFEFQGIQHYKVVPHFHRGGEADLRNQQERDARKEALCDEAEIALVTVPYDLKEKAPTSKKSYSC